jgi:hypothetical protein
MTQSIAYYNSVFPAYPFQVLTPIQQDQQLWQQQSKQHRSLMLLLPN